MLFDKRILALGAILLIVGMVLLINLEIMTPLGQSGMTEDEILDLMIRQQENQDLKTLAGILVGVGFLLILISFGARRRKGSQDQKIKKTI